MLRFNTFKPRGYLPQRFTEGEVKSRRTWKFLSKVLNTVLSQDFTSVSLSWVALNKVPWFADIPNETHGCVVCDVFSAVTGNAPLGTTAPWSSLLLQDFWWLLKPNNKTRSQGCEAAWCRRYVRTHVSGSAKCCCSSGDGRLTQYLEPCDGV